jgi:hypothetical protein
LVAVKDIPVVKKEDIEVPELPTLYRVDVGQDKILPKVEVSEPEKSDEQFVVEEKNESGKLVVLALLLVVLVLSVGGYLFMRRKNIIGGQVSEIKTKRVIVEQMYVPNTQSVNMVDARLSTQKRNEVPINPELSNVEVVVGQAKLTIKEGYSLAETYALKWSADAKLAFIKSLGTVTPEGKSTEWQVMFYSSVKKKSYEVIVWEDKVVSEKELNSELVGQELPKNWFDSSDAIISLRSSPQFATGTVSSINFFYNSDSKDWIYGLQTSLGGTAMHVQ